MEDVFEKSWMIWDLKLWITEEFVAREGWEVV